MAREPSRITSPPGKGFAPTPTAAFARDENMSPIKTAANNVNDLTVFNITLKFKRLQANVNTRNFKRLLRRQLRPERMLAVGTGSSVFEQHGEVRMHHPIARRDRVVIHFDHQRLREVGQL